jgi:hypothetical protein
MAAASSGKLIMMSAALNSSPANQSRPAKLALEPVEMPVDHPGIGLRAGRPSRPSRPTTSMTSKGGIIEPSA